MSLEDDGSFMDQGYFPISAGDYCQMHLPMKPGHYICFNYTVAGGIPVDFVT
jgi:hypothetical protein